MEIIKACPLFPPLFELHLLSLPAHRIGIHYLSLLYSKTFTQLNGNCHWLILGHMALTKIKCIPVVIHSSNNCTTLGIHQSADDQSMVESGLTEGGKNNASFHFRG